MYPMAVVGTASRGLIIYQLENQPKEFQKVDSPLKHQVGFVIHNKFYLSATVDVVDVNFIH